MTGPVSNPVRSLVKKPSTPARTTAIRRGTLVWTAGWTVAALLLGLSAWSYLATRGDDGLRFGKARDAALTAGRQDIARLNTVDAAHLDRDLGLWLDATTGPLHDQLTRTHSADAGQLKAAGTSTRGTVTDAAVTELDTRAGTAKVIATVQVRVSPRDGTATTDRKRFEAGLSRTGGTWKLTALTAVPVGSS